MWHLCLLLFRILPFPHSCLADYHDCDGFKPVLPGKLWNPFNVGNKTGEGQVNAGGDLENMFKLAITPVNPKMGCDELYWQINHIAIARDPQQRKSVL